MAKTKNPKFSDLSKQLAKTRDALEKEREELHDFLAQYEELVNAGTEAIEYLNNAIARLSEVV